MTERKDIDSCSSAQLLERAYTLKSPRQALALYHDWATTYDKHLEEGLQYIGPAEIAGLLAAALEDRTALVLDVGCGTGLVGEYLAAHGFSAIDGLDFSPQMLAVAAQ
ncbi:MAG TPA: methyltransferase domain-containing protein, partial [Arenicellales bacterium]|nr:methyltransferase domain-containing protein [Arenicellales bacterium]